MAENRKESMSLKLVNIHKQYEAPDGSVVPVLHVPELELASGDQAALVGTSGSGKTTLLHILAGILLPDSGQVIYHLPDLPVQEITQLSEAQRDRFRGRHLGYIFQTHHLLWGLSAMENVLLGMSFTGRRPDRAWAEHLLREVGLGQRLHYRPGKLSVGQQQRVAVARAMANRPKWVLADEPTGALDEANAQQVLKLIRSLCQEISAGLLLVTHDLSIAEQLGRKIELQSVNRLD